MSTSFTINDQAARGFQNASAYDKSRPSYPADSVDKLLRHLGVAGEDGAKVIDLACGTGKFTRHLAERSEQYEIVAVEPHDAMREELEKKGLGSRLKIVKGEATNMPIENGWADALIAAQAFHWFDNKDALKEIHRVLRPGGQFGMIWNVEDYNAPVDWPSSSKWELELRKIVSGLEDGQSRFRDMNWKQVFEEQQDTTPWQTLKDTFTHNFPSFSLPLGEEKCSWDRVWLSDEKIWERYSTLSQIANLPDEQKAAVHEQVLVELKKHGERNEQGEVALHGVTYMAWTSRV